MRKKRRKKGDEPRIRRNARRSQRLSFQKNPSEENREESRLKGENKVECKKWSAKGTYRKASAEREPTQDLNTLGGQRPRADSKRERAFRRARFFVSVGLWVCGYGCLLCCVVARSDAKPSCMLCCGVVGLWCVCVCVLLAAWVPKSSKNLLRSPTSTKTEQKWDQNRPQMGPIWARGGDGGTEN